MPYGVVDGDVLEVSLNCAYGGQRVLSVLHYKLQTTAGPIDGLTTIDTFDADFNAAAGASFVKLYMDCMNPDYSLQEVVYQWVHSVRRARVTKLPNATVGTNVGTPSPPNIGAAITKRSEVAGRHGVSTLHLSGLINAYHTLGSLTPAGVDIYSPFLPKVFETIGVGGVSDMIPIIFNRASPADSVEITGASVRPTVRTMHRRTVGVGE